MSEKRDQSPAHQRYLPTISLPESPYFPGISPTKLKDDFTIPSALGEPAFVPQPKWQDQPYYLYGIDLFNNDHYWEAHEIWGSALKTAKGFDEDQTLFFQALIQLSAAHLHSHCGRWRQAKFQAGRAILKFQTLNQFHELFMGLDLTAIISILNDYLAEGTGRTTKDRLHLVS